MSQPEIHRTERDGVPVLWVSDDRTPRLSLVFRSGRIDESLTEIGAHHLVEHLALESLGPVPYEINGRVTPLATVFQAIGDPEDLARFLVDLCDNLAALPTVSVDRERWILGLEHGDDSGELGVSDILLAVRWGATPLGRLAHPEEGLLTLRADDLRELARRRFVRGAALLCWSGGEPPADLRLPLPAGPNHPLPADLADPVVPLPIAFHADANGSPGFAASAVVPDDAAHLIACGILSERLQRSIRGDHLAAYAVGMAWDDVLPGHAHVFWGSPLDPRGAARATTAAIEELLRDWPEDEVGRDLDRVRRRHLDELMDAGSRHGVLIDEARRQLTGQPAWSIADRRSALEAVDVAAIERAQRTLQATAMLCITPELPHPGHPFHEVEPDQPLDVRDALVFETKELRRSKRDRLSITDEGLQYEASGMDPAVFRWTDLVSAVRTLDGPWELTSREGAWLYVAPVLFKDPRGVESALQQYVPATARQLAIGEAQVPATEERAAADLTPKQRKRCADDLRELAQLLGPDEQLERLAEASRGIKSGILAITDARTLHLFVGDLTTEIAHADLTGLRIEHPLSGVRLVLETAGETVAFGGDRRSAEFVALRDLLDELRFAEPQRP